MGRQSYTTGGRPGTGLTALCSRRHGSVVLQVLRNYRGYIWWKTQLQIAQPENRTQNLSSLTACQPKDQQLNSHLGIVNNTTSYYP